MESDCGEDKCFFKQVDERHIHVCSDCKRNKKAETPEEDYYTKIQRDGY
jgi:hypothetical protein